MLKYPSNIIWLSRFKWKAFVLGVALYVSVFTVWAAFFSPPQIHFFSFENKYLLSFQIWDKKSILFPSDDHRLSYAQYGNLTFSQYVYRHKDLISNSILKRHSWGDCKRIYRLIRRYIPHPKPGMVFADIGANIGSCSLVALAMNFTTIAFEPLPTNLHIFTRSIFANPAFLPKVTLYPIALGNTETTVTFKFKYDNLGSSSILDGFDGIHNPNFHVRESTLSHIFQNFNKTIEFMKIDVEGYEPYVIEGGENLLKNHQVKIIYYERTCHTREIDPNIFQKMDYLFEKYNYISSNTTCRGNTGYFNVLVISDEYLKANKIHFKKSRSNYM